jgi:hypothetical protein
MSISAGPGCPWRNYPVANENPVRASAFVMTKWTPSERCGGCGAALGDPVKAR